MRRTCSLIAAVLAFALNPLAYSATPYQVHVGTEVGLSGATMVTINFLTVERFSSMCGRRTMAYSVSLPEPEIGRITFDTALLPESICLMAFGPHRGGIQLQLGESLPNVPDGYYSLVIDQEQYGYLFVDEGTAELLAETEMPPLPWSR